jgi:hypothetical protein
LHNGDCRREEVENRFHSPYKHWVRGLFAEVVFLSLFVIALALIGVAVVWAR